MQIFSKRLKELRTNSNLTQTELAKKIGYSQSNIAKWENAQQEPTLTAIKNIANLFNVCSNYLLGKQDWY